MARSPDDPPRATSRRTLLRASAATGLGIAFAGSLDAVAGTTAHVGSIAHVGTAPRVGTTRAVAGYGPLVDDPKGVLALPRGFSYRIVAESGVTRLDDGDEPTPSDPDGSAAFPRDGGTSLVTNHEAAGDEEHHVPTREGLTYDPGAGGGTTTVEIDDRGRRVREYVGLAGTVNNCAGGVTPWGTWLTCEETEARAGEELTEDHGFVFEVSPDGADNAGNSPVPLRFLGRYSHEACAVDPVTRVVYLTEDASGPNGLFYRWVPPSGFGGGRWALRQVAENAGDTAGALQAMRCTRGGRHVRDLSEATRTGTRYDVEWVDVPDRLAASESTRTQLGDGRVTRSRKFEGACWADGGAYVVASYAREDDGSANTHDGQIWFYEPAARRITLTTIFTAQGGEDGDDGEDGGGDRLDGPDNITLSPHGGVVVSEDGEGAQHLVGVTAKGRAYPLARNELNDSEFAGPTFSRDGRWLFAGIQSPGHVLAITGPWGG